MASVAENRQVGNEIKLHSITFVWEERMLELDHMAIAARTLSEGTEVVESKLGIQLQKGGRHNVFGTHNMLLGLEDGLYLEVIAIDPNADLPGRARCFDLDGFDEFPKLQNWICRTANIAPFLRRYPHAGTALQLQRDNLRWQMSATENGIFPYDNRFPAVIEWQCEDHPAAMLEPSGLRLNRLVVVHPEAVMLENELESELEEPRVVFETGETELRAEFTARNGKKVFL